MEQNEVTGISGVLLCSRNVQDKILGQHPEMYDVTSFFQQILPNESLAQIYHSIYHQQFENKERAMDKAFSFWTSIDLVGSCWIHRHLIHLLNVLWDLKDLRWQK
jgi:hypothetical protein